MNISSTKFLSQLYLQENIEPTCPIKLCQKLGITLSVLSPSKLKIDIPNNVLKADYFAQGKLEQELMSLSSQIILKLKQNEEIYTQTLEKSEESIKKFIGNQKELAAFSEYLQAQKDNEGNPHDENIKEKCNYAWEKYIKDSQTLPTFKPFLQAKLWMYQHQKKIVKKIL